MKLNWCGWALGVALMTAVVGCGSESNGEPSSLADLGIDDGASEGLSTSALVKKDQDAELKLDTGGAVKIPRGAVDNDIELGLKRPPDKEALAFIKHLDKKQSPISAPYVVTPHGTKFKKDVELTLPASKGANPRKLKVLWLEDERDTKWKTLDVPELSGSKASVKLAHFSVLVLVEEDGSSEPGDAPAPDTGSVSLDGGLGGEEGDARDEGDVDASPAEGDATLGAGMDETDAGRPSDVVLSQRPIDLATDCPASGCTLAFPSLPDGVWADCPVQTGVSGFDPTTFDFATACETATPSSGNVEFVHNGVSRRWEAEFDSCDSETTVRAGTNHLYIAECNDYMTAVRVEQTVEAQDGVIYEYDLEDCDGSCSASLYVNVFRPGDTTALNANCSAALGQSNFACPDARVVFPYGPGGVGTLPPALVDTTWLSCESDGADPAAECASELADPFMDGYASAIRLNADGTMDDLYYETQAWSATCGIRAGSDRETLRLFWCADPQDPDGWGTQRLPWEVQRIGGRDYLIVHDSDDYEDIDVYVAAPAGLIPSNDPCASAPALTCVLP